MSTLQIMALDFHFYRSSFQQYWNAGFRGPGPSDEFIEMYCMSGEL